MTISRVVATSRLFQGLDESQLVRIASIERSEHYSSDTVLFQEDDRLTDLYIVEKGAVRLTMDARLWNADLTLRSIVTIVAESGTFGWSALLAPHLATLSAETEGAANLIALNGQALFALMEDDHRMGYHVMGGLAALVASRLEATRLSLMSERARDLEHLPLAI